MARRFRGFLPVVVDVETGGSTPKPTLYWRLRLFCSRQTSAAIGTYRKRVEPCGSVRGANIDRAALEFNGIIPDHPLRFALSEKEALNKVLTPVRQAVKEAGCTRAVWLGTTRPSTFRF